MKTDSQDQDRDGFKLTDRDPLQDHKGKAKEKEMGKATSRGKSDGGPGGEGPHPALALPLVGSNVQNTLLHN